MMASDKPAQKFIHVNLVQVAVQSLQAPGHASHFDT